MTDSPQLRETAKRMAEAASRFLETLGQDQRRKAIIDFGDDEERTNWHYVPQPRNGLPLKEMDPRQRQAALALAATGLSEAAHARAKTIIELELILGEIEGPGQSSTAIQSSTTSACSELWVQTDPGAGASRDTTCR